MSVILEQTFPLGRFHATRWRENIFEDRYGEWPPSPWRLLRALAARWIQFSRETGNVDIELRDELLRKLASEIPCFHLPDGATRPSETPRQYHRTGVEWTAKGAKDSAYRKPMSTLVPDPFWTVPQGSSVYWFWNSLKLGNEAERLLIDLTKRITYFGRVESFCQIRKLPNEPTAKANCELSDKRESGGQPVLVAFPGTSLNIESLLAATDDSLVLGLTSPPAATWRYARLPARPRISMNNHPTTSSTTTNLVQFAVGGRVYPTVDHWVHVTGRFRGRVLRNLALSLSQGKTNRFEDLPSEDRELFSGMSGKDAQGTPLTDHSHAYFALIPDDNGFPTRLVCYRQAPFMSEELEALQSASEHPISWQFKRDNNRDQKLNDNWRLQIVTLPSQVLPPACFDLSNSAKIWESLTPFVPPGNRRRFRRNGRLRTGETPVNLLKKMLVKHELPQVSLEQLGDAPQWVSVHETASQRRERSKETTRNVRQGVCFRLVFEESVHAPLIVGHSSHFGLGLFRPLQ